LFCLVKHLLLTARHGVPSKNVSQPKKNERITGPLITTPGERGPDYPVEENRMISFFPDLNV